MKNIPTAEEFLEKEHDVMLESIADGEQSYTFAKDFIANWLKEFAKLHVEAAIQECIESAPCGSSTDTVSYEDVVNALKDCYPLDLIK
jgi:hypothetical protein